MIILTSLCSGLMHLFGLRPIVKTALRELEEIEDSMCIRHSVCGPHLYIGRLVSRWDSRAQVAQPTLLTSMRLHPMYQ